MAFTLKATKYWRPMVNCHFGGGQTNINWQRAGFVSGSTPKSAAAATSHSTGGKLKSKADRFPIYILFGFMGGAVFLAVKSVTQQLVHHPGVQVNKSKRSMIPEVDSPDSALASGDSFISKSVLRKVAHIQNHNDVMPMDRTPDVYSTDRRSRESITLKTVGVEPGAGGNPS